MKINLNMHSKKSRMGNPNNFEMKTSNSVDENWTLELLGLNQDARRRK